MRDRADRQFIPARFRTRLTTEMVIRQQRQQDLCRSADDASLRYMSAEDTSLRIRHSDMEMRTVGR